MNFFSFDIPSLLLRGPISKTAQPECGVVATVSSVAPQVLRLYHQVS